MSIDWAKTSWYKKTKTSNNNLKVILTVSTDYCYNFIKIFSFVISNSYVW